eukprot:gene22717-31000_t
MNPYGYIFGSTLVSVLSYTAAVEMNHRKMSVKESSFQVGSADFLVMDNLNTGDVMLFSRKWYNYHIPTAAMILIYKYAYRAEFDHGAIVIVDTSGVAKVLERTPFGGITYRPFDTRIIRSKSEQIILIPVTPPLSIRSSEIKSALERVTEIQKRDRTGEVWYFFRSVFSRYFSASRICCPSTDVIFTMYDILGYLPTLCTDENSANSGDHSESGVGNNSASSSNSSQSNNNGGIVSTCNLTHFYSRTVNFTSPDDKIKHSFLADNIFIRMR